MCIAKMSHNPADGKANKQHIAMHELTFLLHRVQAFRHESESRQKIISALKAYTQDRRQGLMNCNELSC